MAKLELIKQFCLAEPTRKHKRDIEIMSNSKCYDLNEFIKTIIKSRGMLGLAIIRYKKILEKKGGLEINKKL